MANADYYQDLLAEELIKRCRKNPRYSTRAFAKALNIHVSSLSRILSGQQIPSYKICEKVFCKLELSPSDQKCFLISVATKQKALGLKRIAPVFKKIDSIKENRIDISADIWKSIADWYHGAIMELTFTAKIDNNPKKISQELDITEIEANQAVKRLIRLGLLEVQNGVLVKTHTLVASADKNLTSSAHQRQQKQILKKAIDSLENDPIEHRNMTSMTMAIDPNKVSEAKKMIQKFSRELCQYLETGKRKQVYQLGVCLYPISKLQGGK